jgi:hypothetical protein
MAATFNESQKIDYLWKKVGYAVTKTAEATVKEAFNESIPSPLLYRGDLVWMESDQITGNPPATTTSIIKVYKDGVGSFSPSVECTEDLTAPDNQTWKTNEINWVPTQFGDNYLVQVYVANTGVTNPQTSGTKLFQAGSGRDDTWFFDYQSGVLNFNGANVPTQIASPITGKSVYVVGYQYVGLIGVTNQPSGNISGNTNIGNLNFTDTTISTITANSNIFLSPNGSGNIHVTTLLTASGNIVANTGAFFIGDGGYLANLNSSGVANGNSNVNIPVANGNINLTATGNTTLVVTGTGANVFGYLTVTGNLTATNITSNVSSNTVTANSGNISGNLFVADTATVGNLRTNNILYANGQPWDLQEAAGSNTQIQFNDGNTNFGASANFTFNQTTNLLTVVGNSQFTNANLGNLATANYFTGTLTTATQPNITSVGILSGLSVSGGIEVNGNVQANTNMVVIGNISSGNANLGNLATANYANISGNIYVADTASIGNVRTDNILYANGEPWDLQQAAGANTQLQYNDGNTNFGASANLTYDDATQLFTVIGNSQFNNANISSNLYVGNTASIGNVRTDNLLYANGVPWDLQEAAGLINQIQYNADNGDFGASANFTYNDTTQLVTVAGNITVSNATLGNLASANYINVLANLHVADTANVGVLRTNYLLYANGQPWDLQEAAGANTQIQFNDGNTNFGASSNFTFNSSTNLLTVTGTANVTNFNASGTISAIGNLSAGNANLGNLTTSNYFHGIFDNTSSSQPNITSVGNLSNLFVGNATSNVVIANGDVTATGNINATNMNGNFSGTFTGNVNGNITGIGSNTQVLFNYDGDVNGSNAFIFDYAANVLILTGTGNIFGNLNVSSNVTAANGVFGNISTTGVAGDITGANLISTVTLNASGNITSANANLGNTSIANNVVANTFRMGVGDNEFYQSTVYFATTNSTSPNQLLWSTSLANLSAIDFTIISTDVAGNTRQTAKIAAAVLGTEVVFNEYSGLYINGGVGSFSVNYQAGSPDTIQLVVTPDSTNLTKYNLMIIQYAK